MDEPTAQRIVDYTIANHGGTFDLDGTPIEGEDVWAVGGYGTAEWHLPSLDAGDVMDFARENAIMGYESLGTWEDDGYFYLDVVMLHSDLQRALAAAARNSQKAIYNLLTRETIRLEDN